MGLLCGSSSSSSGRPPHATQKLTTGNDDDDDDVKHPDARILIESNCLCLILLSEFAGTERVLADSDQRRRGVLRHSHHRELLGFPSGTFHFSLLPCKQS